MNDQRTANDGQWPDQLGHIVADLQLCHAVLLSHDVPKISGVAHLILWPTVSLTLRVEMSASARASVRIVAKLVHVKSVLARLQTANFARDRQGPRFRFLLQMRHTLHLSCQCL